MKKIILLFLIVSQSLVSIGFSYRELKIRELRGFYNLEVYIEEFTPSDYTNQYTKFDFVRDEDGEEIDQLIDILHEEFMKYPPEWIEESNLKGIAIVKNMEVIGQKRFAMPDAYGEVLYYDIGYGYAGESYIRHGIHHEFFHMIEENFNGTFRYQDPKWLKLNTPGFSYGDGGDKAYDDPDFVNNIHPQKGFITGYSTYGIEEDRAEIYAYLFQRDNYKLIMDITREDDILDKKVKYIKEFIKSIVQDMDEEYFVNINR